MPTPRPGRPVRGSRSGRPIMAALDLLGRRWSLRVLWELRSGALPFRALRDACEGVSPTVLNTRLRELQEAGVVESTDAGYVLTRHGQSLSEALAPLDRWARGWARGR
jgi:DNA-binding HxlR family transcriptional regulator